MNNNLTEMVYILDMSGSMEWLKQDTIGGYNAFIKEQKELEGEACMTTVLFDDRYILLHDHINIKDVPELTAKEYRPAGMTAMMDAIGKTINAVGVRLANTPEEERPGKVIFMIMTDGYENSSREFTRSAIKSMIEHQQKVYSWEFIFVGSGIDAYAEAASIGISDWNTMSVTADAFSGGGGGSAYCAMSCATKSIRTKGILDADWKTEAENVSTITNSSTQDSAITSINSAVSNKAADLTAVI